MRRTLLGLFSVCAVVGAQERVATVLADPPEIGHLYATSRIVADGGNAFGVALSPALAGVVGSP